MALNLAISGAPSRDRVERRLVLAIARKELRDAVRNRWFWLYAGGFTALASALVLAALPGAQIVGSEGFGRTAASLVGLAQLVIPLLGLLLGAQTVATQHERGTLRFLLSHPVSRTEVFWGLYVGQSLAMFAVVAGGFGAAALLSAGRGVATDPSLLATMVGLSWLLSLIAVGIGMFIGAASRRAGAAVGTALVVWFALVFLGDLGIMGTAVATRLPVGVLFFAALANPVEAFRLLAVAAFRGSFDVLGPAGSYAVDALNGRVAGLALAVLAAWVLAPAALGWWRFRTALDL